MYDLYMLLTLHHAFLSVLHMLNILHTPTPPAASRNGCLTLVADRSGDSEFLSSFNRALPPWVPESTRSPHFLVPGNVSLFQVSLTSCKTCPRDQLDFASNGSPREAGKRARVSTV